MERWDHEPNYPILSHLSLLEQKLLLWRLGYVQTVILDLGSLVNGVTFANFYLGNPLNRWMSHDETQTHEFRTHDIWLQYRYTVAVPAS